jgi:hypothetical protein
MHAHINIINQEASQASYAYAKGSFDYRLMGIHNKAATFLEVIA